MYQVYGKVNENNEIYDLGSPAYIENLDEWVFIDEGLGERYMFYSTYFPKSIADDNGIYRYLYIDGKVVERTEEELAMEFAKIPQDETLSTVDLANRVAELEEQLAMYEIAYAEGVNAE